MDASLNEDVENPILSPVPADHNTIVLHTPMEKTIQLLGFRVSVISVQLGHSARLGIFLNCIHEEKPFIDYKEIVIEGEEYLGWGNDDKYIIDLVNSKISSLL